MTAVEPGRSLTITTGAGDVRTDYRYALVPDGEDTRLSLTVDVAVSDQLGAMAEEIRASIAEADGGHLAGFKRFAEKAP